MKKKEKVARQGTRTPDLLVRRAKMHYTPTHASLNQPIESAQEPIRFGTVSDAFVPRSRTITRTICAAARPGTSSFSADDSQISQLVLCAFGKAA